MGIVPQTVCPRCHRKYAALRPSCPYCRYKNEKEPHRPVPGSDSAVRDSAAANRAKENLSWQFLTGAVLIVLVIVAMIAVISVNMQGRVDDEITIAAAEAVPDIEIETTPVPDPTPSPTPSPTPAPVITSVQINLNGAMIDDFTERQGVSIQLTASPYPQTVEVDIKWSSSDESVATVDDTGLVTMVGSSGYCTITADAGTASATCIARVGNW